MTLFAVAFLDEAVGSARSSAGNVRPVIPTAPTRNKDLRDNNRARRKSRQPCGV